MEGDKADQMVNTDQEDVAAYAVVYDTDYCELECVKCTSGDCFAGICSSEKCVVCRRKKENSGRWALVQGIVQHLDGGEVMSLNLPELEPCPFSVTAKRLGLSHLVCALYEDDLPAWVHKVLRM